MLQRTFSLGLALAAVLGVCLWTGPVLAQDKPDAKEVMEKYIQVTGGREAHEKVKNIVAEGTIEVSAVGIKGSFKSWQATQQQVVEIDISGIGKMVEGTDGKNAWSVSAVQGNRVKEGKELDEALFDAELHGELNWQKRYKKVETVGIADVEGKQAYKVIATPEKATPRTMYFDKDSGLLLKVESKQTTPMGEFEAEMFLGDYREVSGIKVPLKNRLKISGQEMVITLEKIQANVEIPKDRFAVPAEVKDLLKK